MLFKKKSKPENEDYAVQNEDKKTDEEVKAEYSNRPEQAQNGLNNSDDKESFMQEKLLFTAQKGLESLGMDKAFAPLLTADTEEATMENIKAFKSLFMDKLEEEITKRLKGSVPKTGKELNEDYDPFLDGFNM